VAAGTDLTIRHRKQIFSERDAEGLKDILRRVEWDTTDKQQFVSQVCALPAKVDNASRVVPASFCRGFMLSPIIP
jgi:hypothetical protein